MFAVVLCLVVAAAAMVSAESAFVWPGRLPTLSALTEAQYASWEADGYLVVPDAVPPSITRDIANAVREFVGATDGNRSSWYENTADIYNELLADGSKPHHGPCGMVQMYHHSSLWAMRTHPRLHNIFADLYGTRRLYVTVDRAHFKPPADERFPAWSDPGAVHVGLHWDVDTRPSNWPVPYVLQGVIYLDDTTAEQGALRVVPGFHKRFAAWSAAQPANRSAERPEGAAAAALAAEAVPIPASAGSLVVWHSLLPHGPGPNLATRPRISAYVSMLPTEAGPYLGPTRHPDEPLSMSDAGTLAYHETLQAAVHVGSAQAAASDTASDTAAAAAAGHDAAQLRRQSRERRVERWRSRLPMLDEDPLEAELPRRPPGEEDGSPAQLTPLGERLVGLLEWETEEAEATCQSE